MFLLDGENLEELLRKVVREEMSKIATKITREPKVLTRDGAAEKIGVCPNTISEFIKNGRLTNRGIGRKILILDSDLDGIRVKEPVSYTKHRR